MTKRLPLLVVAALCISVVPAAAQRRRLTLPDTGMWAVGGSLGGGSLRPANVGSGIDAAGNVERYLTPRFSLRGQLGGGWNNVDDRGVFDNVSPFFVEGNVVYNWEAGIWHPYATGGLGLYRYQSFARPRGADSEVFPGVNVGGGIEYFANRLLTFTGELVFHDLGHDAAPFPELDRARFWTLTVGVKKYFF